MELRVLGPVELLIAGRPVDLESGRTMAVIAVLGLEGGRPIPRDTVALSINDDEPMNLNTFNSYVTRARNRLEAVGADRTAIVNRSGTCALKIDPRRVDWLRFQELRSRAKTAERSGDEDTALARLDTAVALWQGEPLTGLSGVWATRTREYLRRAHRGVLSDWARLALDRRDPDDIVGLLSKHAARYPDDEPLTLKLMKALHASGRTTEAMDVYHTIKQRLSEHHGTDPGADLQRTFQSLLGATARPRGSPSSSQPRPPRPQRDNLSRDIPDFTGRHTELAALLSSARSPSPTAATVHVINGMAGVGKTALATHAAHRLKDAFPDGRYFIRLHGAHAQHAPKDPGEALHELLVMLDVAAESIPASLEQRAALWRDRTSGIRALLILDDAADDDQALPLIPGGSGCTVFITSRRRLHAVEGARHIKLGVPSHNEALMLFRELAGHSTDPDGTQTSHLVAIAERLPLALRLLANRWRQHPAWSPDDLVVHLRRTRERITEFAVGKLNLHTIFLASLRDLTPEARSTFFLLGHHPTPEFGISAAAALIGKSTRETSRLLDELTDTSLLDEPHAHRYTMHALLADFARMQSDISPSELRVATYRAMDYYTEACSSIHEDKSSFAVERQNILSVLTWARLQGGLEIHEAKISRALAKSIDPNDLSPNTVELYQRAVEILRNQDNQELLAQSLVDLGKALISVGDLPQASIYIHEALRICERVVDQSVKGRALVQLGVLKSRRGSLTDARMVLRRALRLFHSTRDRHGIAISIASLAHCDWIQGDFFKALSGFQESLLIFEDLADKPGQAKMKSNIAGCYYRLEKYEDADRLLNEGIDLLDGLDLKSSIARLRTNFGEINSLRGNHQEALSQFNAALAIHREMRDRWAEIATLANMGRAHLNLGSLGVASADFHESLRLAEKLGDPIKKCEALLGLGDVLRAQRDISGAEVLYRMSLHAAEAHGLIDETTHASGRLAEIAGPRETR
ncbi:tetratricopeptide repeat protein [Nocardiopsis sediminis]|uniref:Tetratricopeptide repeat protein n=1 Tax=Nocardiopsis sediminis TaxID=1778267 RepID=A0ABV8FM07_9ACTN